MDTFHEAIGLEKVKDTALAGFNDRGIVAWPKDDATF
jgi:hypothetical protein